MSRRKDVIDQELDNAETYEQWKAAAMRSDQKSGLDYWKNVDRSGLYDFKAIRQRLDRLRDLRVKGDNHGLMFSLNEGIHGNMAGMGRSSLYKKARFGTKNLIVEYIEEIGSALLHLASDRTEDIPLEEKFEFFQRASHCFGRSALMLSGSGTLLYFHLGVVKALWEQQLLPPIISGSSGGALVSALVGTHSRADLAKIFTPEYISIEVTKEASKLANLNIFKRAAISPEAAAKLYERLIPDLTFQEAFHLTGLQINVSVAPAEKHQSSRLLNAVASPNVMIREAVMASCAFPGAFPPVTLAAKNQRGERQAYLASQKWIDGSVSDDMPIKRVARLYGVNHFIVSQTNPIALPFVSESKDQNSWGIIKHAMRNTTREWLLAGTKLISKPVGLNPSLSKLVNMTSSVLAQTYTGDINILPPRRLHNPMGLLSGRTTEEAMDMIRDGERACWPYIETIRLQTNVSHVLDRILRDMEIRLINDSKRSRTEVAMEASR
ncbi:DUF3336 domain-containing protein [Zhongshania sp.]|jgi:TAG lipase/steryl ester hydrolase/phospholipase A2/LPA acyltransferase|uniref:DUF3336 domain-containing protein n=1 Tax=Zhongshania sp. TaxID=1971902 RepID=UPI0039E2D717